MLRTAFARESASPQQSGVELRRGMGRLSMSYTMVMKSLRQAPLNSPPLSLSPSKLTNSMGLVKGQFSPQSKQHIFTLTGSTAMSLTRNQALKITSRACCEEFHVGIDLKKHATSHG